MYMRQYFDRDSTKTLNLKVSRIAKLLEIRFIIP